MKVEEVTGRSCTERVRRILTDLSLRSILIAIHACLMTATFISDSSLHPTKAEDQITQYLLYVLYVLGSLLILLELQRINFISKHLNDNCRVLVFPWTRVLFHALAVVVSGYVSIFMLGNCNVGAARWMLLFTGFVESLSMFFTICVILGLHLKYRKGLANRFGIYILAREGEGLYAQLKARPTEELVVRRDGQEYKLLTDIPNYRSPDNIQVKMKWCIKGTDELDLLELAVANDEMSIKDARMKREAAANWVSV